MRVPTQWLIIDATADARVRGWLQPGAVDTIDLLTIDRDGTLDDPDALKQYYIESRPSVLRAVFASFDARRSQGSRGRLVVWVVGDAEDPFGRLILTELPLDISQAVFWRTNYAPGMLRVCIGPDRDGRRCYLSGIQAQYFSMPDFSPAYYGQHEEGRLYGNEFDSTLVSPDDEGVRRILDHLQPLHLEEFGYASQFDDPPSGGGMMVIEHVLKWSREWRKVDWFALSAYPYFARLWDTEKSDILEILDFRRCPRRASDPWAALSSRAREANWDHLGLTQPAVDVMHLEKPYRVSPGDSATRFLLAEFLLNVEKHGAALEQCQIASAEDATGLPEAWKGTEGMARHGLGQEVEARELLTDYRTGLKGQPDPSAQTLDKIAGLDLMLGDWAEAAAHAEEAVGKDPHLLNAYNALIIASRQSGNASIAARAKSLAEANGIKIPILAQEEVREVMSKAKIVEPTEKKWWQFWK